MYVTMCMACIQDKDSTYLCMPILNNRDKPFQTTPSVVSVTACSLTATDSSHSQLITRKEDVMNVANSIQPLGLAVSKTSVVLTIGTYFCSSSKMSTMSFSLFSSFKYTPRGTCGFKQLYHISFQKFMLPQQTSWTYLQ